MLYDVGLRLHLVYIIMHILSSVLRHVGPLYPSLHITVIRLA